MSTKSNPIPKYIQNILNDKSGCNLDIGCGANKNPGFVGLDILDLPGVDIVWDFNRTPWPLPDECVLKAVASHVLEHILPTYETARLEPLVQLLVKKGIFTQKEADDELGKPSRGFLGFMDELWRVMKPGGQFAAVMPHASSPGFAQDPTHLNMINETTFHYFCPDHEMKSMGVALYNFYKPLPWRIEVQYFKPDGNLEVLLTKILKDPQYGKHIPTSITEEKL